MKFLIGYVLGVICTVVLIHNLRLQQRHGWTTIVEDEHTIHTIEAPFAYRDNICVAVVLEGKIGTHCVGVTP